MSNPNLTPAQTEALNTVNLHLVGITLGYKPRGERQLVGITDSDYTEALEAVRSLDTANGDRLAIEATGPHAWTDTAANIAHIVPANIPDISLEEIPIELKGGIADLLEQGRRSLQINNIVYAAAHAALRGFSVYMADSSPEEWQALNDELQTTVPDSYHEETRLYFRNNKMLTRLGNIAVAMIGQRELSASSQEDERPNLLFLSGLTHTVRLSGLLDVSGIRFTTNLTEPFNEDSV